MVAIFHFFHNGQCWYFLSFKTQKTEDPNFLGRWGGDLSISFSMQSIFIKWWPFANFIIMGNADILFLSTLGNLENQTAGRLVIIFFSVWSIFMKCWPFCNFITMANADILFLLTLGKPATQTLAGGGGSDELPKICFREWNHSVPWFAVAITKKGTQPVIQIFSPQKCWPNSKCEWICLVQ